MSGLDRLEEVSCLGACEAGESSLVGEASGDTPDGPSETADAGITADAPAMEAATEGNAADSRGSVSPDASCATDLSNLGTGDFHISFVIRTLEQGLVAVVNQRAQCGAGMYWDVRLDGGHPMVETDDERRLPDGGFSEDPRTALIASGIVNDGLPHSVLIERWSEVLHVTIDGVASGSSSSTASFLTLAAVVQGEDPCDGTQDMTLPFKGALSEVCVGTP
jgi:hypothetical protein